MTKVSILLCLSMPASGAPLPSLRSLTMNQSAATLEICKRLKLA
jgi:hypothetical protein